MRRVEFEKVMRTVESLCIDTAYELPEDVLAALEAAARKESNSTASGILKKLIENARIAKEESIPLCQDTGLAVIFVQMGSDVVVDCPAGKTITDAINAGVEAGYEKGYLRKSVVIEPLKARKNTDTNTPAIIHYEIVPGDEIEITLMAKGGGCENKSQFAMFNPTVNKEQIVNWVTDVVNKAGANACPPFVVGVGIGGDFEVCCLLSKKALLRKIGSANQDEFYADLENKCWRRSIRWA